MEPHPEIAEGDRSIGELALGSLLDESSTMRPDEVSGAIARKAAMVGLADATLLFVDKRQVVLLSLPGEDGPEVDIDSTDAGRCFREMQIVAVDEGTTTWLWFPLVDGTHRVGVLGGRVAVDDPLVRARGLQLAELAGELFVAKSSYGDHLVNAHRAEEMTLAAEIRWSLVPPLTFLSPEVSVAGYLEPAYDLAGDTFDYAVNANTVHTAIFDAVGHGMEASRIANMALLSYRHSRRRGLGMVDTYFAMDALIRESFDQSAYVTAQLATLDLPDGALRWISAGHPPPLRVRAGEACHELTGPPTLPAGIGGDDPTIHEVALRPGDVVAFHSDGIADARSNTDELFGVDRLGAMLAEGITNGVALPELVRQIAHAVVEHQGGEVVDDATIVLLGWRA